MKSTHPGESVHLFATEEIECSYLPGEISSNHVIDPNFTMDAMVYSVLSEQGFRRSGNQVYRPGCKHCQQCIATRIEVSNFVLSRRFKRIVNKNKDLQFSIVNNINGEEYYQLYKRYINQRHFNGPMNPPSKQQYDEFLKCNWMHSQYLEWRLNDVLICIAVTDDLDNAFSAIYTFFDPSHAKRSLGTLGVLEQINQALIQAKEYLYLGYWIKESRVMQYKIQFQPLMGFIEGKWQPLVIK
ncbi:MAG: arginyltransferase [Methylococcales bacterium]